MAKNGIFYADSNADVKIKENLYFYMKFPVH